MYFRDIRTFKVFEFSIQYYVQPKIKLDDRGDKSEPQKHKQELQLFERDVVQRNQHEGGQYLQTGQLLKGLHRRNFSVDE
jgi:hypothetical protein